MTDRRNVEGASDADGWVRAVAPAKVNLRLDILGRRLDGFHELATALLALEVADEVRARPREDGQVTLVVDGPHSSPDIPTDGRNLAWRAALAGLEAAAEQGLAAADRGVDLGITKRIPSRAGLGGGSSDAAAALVAVEGALGFELDRSERGRLLAELGSDVPFFDAARSTGYAWCFGRGERVRPLDPPAGRMPWVTLVVPSVESPTAAVYAALGLRPGTAVEGQPIEDVLAGPVETLPSRLSNGLERAATEAVPELAEWRALLDEVDVGAFLLCGSGSGWFGLHTEESAAHAALDAVVAAAAERGLEQRLAVVTRAVDHGARRTVEIER